ncbi:hypothetical protein XCR1_180015 [Xenorhabdus cabanillasii JM26]|uniref:Uncharacterized protein n=1 Tax=Xenorhabdus cabanillasii JM26 TaxID=1427517 RepID=W1J154_9GAMM|nr:hypothetical protein XCR1_180015 [Xenorhabdus cabanillasii JM26]
MRADPFDNFYLILLLAMYTKSQHHAGVCIRRLNGEKKA